MPPRDEKHMVDAALHERLGGKRSGLNPGL